jgi:hypothetical protein
VNARGSYKPMRFMLYGQADLVRWIEENSLEVLSFWVAQIVGQCHA